MAGFAENILVNDTDLKLTFPSNVAIVGPTFSVCDFIHIL